METVLFPNKEDTQSLDVTIDAKVNTECRRRASKLLWLEYGAPHSLMPKAEIADAAISLWNTPIINRNSEPVKIEGDIKHRIYVYRCEMEGDIMEMFPEEFKLFEKLIQIFFRDCAPLTQYRFNCWVQAIDEQKLWG